MSKEKRLENIYAAAIEFVDGLNLKANEVFELMYNAKDYTIPEICYVVNKLYADNFVR